MPSNIFQTREAASRKLSLLLFLLHLLPGFLLSSSQLGLGKRRSSKGLEKQEEAAGRGEVVAEDGSIIGSGEVGRALPLEETRK